MGENFCLRWNDHHDLFFSTAESLCHSSLLTDVVLSAGGSLFQAHKLVLSVCSKFFQDVFAQPQAVPQAHNTVIYLKDVESTHLQLLLTYMYRGQVDVEESELGGFLKTATGLQIKGLSEEQGATTALPARHMEPKARLPLVAKEVTKEAVREVVKEKTTKQREMVSPRKEEEVKDHSSPAKRIKEEEVVVEPVVAGRQVAEYREEVEMEDTQYQDFMEPQAPDMWRLAEERLNKAYPCQYCGMSFAQNWLLKRHWKTHTGEKNFKCTICNRSFSLRDSCVRHLRTVHKELVMTDDVSGLVEDLSGGEGGEGTLGLGYEPALSP